MGADLAHRPRLDLDEMQPCQCPIIVAVEALVRQQIATAIEALPTPMWRLGKGGKVEPWVWLDEVLDVIARGGGSDG